MKTQFVIIFFLISTKLFSQIYEDPSSDISKNSELSIKIGEMLLRMSSTEAISFLEGKDFKTKTYEQIKQRDSTLEKKMIHFPDRKQKMVFLQNNKSFSFGPNTICIEVGKDDVIESLSWNDYKFSNIKYSLELKYSDYERVKTERIAWFHYKNQWKKIEVLVKVGDNDDLIYIFWRSE